MFDDIQRNLGRNIGNTVMAPINNISKLLNFDRDNERSQKVSSRYQPQTQQGFGGSGGSFGTPEPPKVGSWAPDITGMGDLSGNSQEPEMSSREKAYLEAIEAIRRKTEEQYAYDGANDGLVDQAFQGSLDAINNARTKTNDNYGQSRTALDELTNSHVANIKGSDRDQITSNGEELTGSYNKLYDDRTKSLQDDRSAEMAAKTEMLQRLGIQDAGIGTTGQVQTEAIADNTGDKAAALAQSGAYQQADLTRNTELGQNQAAMGVERQSDLRRQLDGILGNLDNSEAGVRNDIASAKLEGRNADKASWDETQKYNNNTLLQLQQQESDQANTDSDRNFKREMAVAKAQTAAKGTGSVVDILPRQIEASTGKNAMPYMSMYNEVLAEGGGALAGGPEDKTAYLVEKMKRKAMSKGLEPDLDMITRVVMGYQNFGTDKLTN